MKRYFSMLLLLVFPALVHAQLTVNFMPEVQGRTLEGVMSAKLMNSQQRRSCYMVVRITVAGGGLVAEAKTPAFDIQPGMNLLPQQAAYNAAWKFGSGKVAVVVKQSHQFPEGEYEYCFELYENVKGAPGELVADQCFNYDLQPLSPLMLTEPYEGDQICEKRPPLFWQPLLPAIPGMEYRLLLVEVKPGQARAEALHYNMPVIRQAGIQAPMLLYPPLSRELIEGKKYAWQVTAVRNDMVLARSEVWDFTVKCEDSVAKRPVDSYRSIDDLAKGNFYIAEGNIHFAIDNPHNGQPLEYSIVSISAPNAKLKKLPKLTLATGRNHILIDLERVKGMTDGHYYLLSVRMPGGETKQLRFLYKTENE
ncbi:DUF928 domain-containing protein [Chitinophaga rhizosphaerae]|uniref:DUF928 domain-containing protein n=1 Tax=Chitinophaga rhizosphaerae TaxID=1864947 RepID=UPI000F80F476|nr:DUF928 domain-containing protein [Chitinophaga rhizosphaerae]